MFRVPHRVPERRTADEPRRGAGGFATHPWLFDTDAIPVEDRPDYWRQAIAQALHVDVSVEPGAEAPFGIRMALQDWRSFRLMGVQGSAHRSLRRGPGRADELCLMLQFEGICEIGDRHTKVTLGPGDVAIMPPDFECVQAPRGSFRHVLIDLGLDLAQELLPQWQGLRAQPFPAGHPAAMALVGLTRWMLSHGSSLPEDAREGLANSLLALVPNLAQADGEATVTDAPQALPPLARAQRQRVEAFIRENLADAALDVGTIARELGLSVRYVHKLFAGGPGVMQWVQEQRLQACRDELARRGTRAVASIAYSWGFACPSHFSRAFRRRFGISPSQA